jgi:hypothetical protein
MQTFNSEDPIKLNRDRGFQKIFFYKKFPVTHITPNYTLDEFILMVNQDNLILCGNSILTLARSTEVTVDPAQLVKINQLYHSFQKEDVVKPLLLDCQSGKFRPNTGDSRIRALSLVPRIQYVPAFVSYNKDQTERPGGVEILDFTSYAQACAVPESTNFWFSFGEDHRIDWYEVSKPTVINCAGQDFSNWCRQVLDAYIQEQPEDFLFSREWFTQDINWTQYVLE